MKPGVKTVFVGLSGGVDSSVAAARLKDQGYNVVGVFIKVWHPDFLECNWEQERLDAMRVAARLDIPFLTCDAEQAYRDSVAEYFINEYKAGRTPNPDVLCNQHVKFGAFLEFAKDRGADYVATGHYARRTENPDTTVSLLRGLDTNKDQTYFLWTLKQVQLQKVLFPVGDTPKDVIRAEAAKYNLPTSTKKDSQGICFLGHVNIPEFLSHYIDIKPGNVVDTHGTVVGEHVGAFVYTLGQRHGFTLHTAEETTVPHYVIAKNINTNTITVSTKPPQSSASTDITLEHCSWTESVPEIDSVLHAQFRYRQKPFLIHIKAAQHSHAVIKIQSDTDTPASGQSCVIYDGERCLGGGIIA